MSTIGQISSDDFCEAARWLLAVSERIGDKWQLNTAQNVIGCNLYLSHKDVKAVNTCGVDIEDETIHTTVNDNDEMQSNISIRSDEGTLVCDSSGLVTCVLEHHIVYSHSYSVPVLYFNIYKPGGQLLSLDELWNYCRPVVQSKHEYWSTLTQQEHPLLRRPYFCLHPCHTANFMAQLDHKNQSPRSYLLRWLSTVAPVVLLDVPLIYATEAETTNPTTDTI